MLAHDNPTDAQMTECIERLLEALDTCIPNPDRDVDKPLIMPIEGVYSIAGRGTVVTGKVEQGTIRVGDAVEIVGLGEQPMATVCTSIESFNRVLESAEAGQNVGCLLRGIGHSDVQRGQVLSAKGSLTPRTAFEAEVYVLSKEEGGRHTPFTSGYTPQFFFRTTNVTGTASILGDAEMCLPGEGVQLNVCLQNPVAISTGDRFAVREGGRTVGSGIVTKVMN